MAQLRAQGPQEGNKAGRANSQEKIKNQCLDLTLY